MNPSRSAGFTLVELITLLAILSILATLAAPALAQLLKSSQDQAAMEELNHLLHYARSQAVERKRTLNLCPSLNGIDCVTDWSKPWLLTESGKKLYHSTPYSGSSSLQWSGFSAAIRFHSNGTSPTSNGRFYICNEQVITRQLVINRQGRIRLGGKQENQEQSHRCPQQPRG